MGRSLDDAVKAFGKPVRSAAARDGGTASVILLDLRMPIMDGWAFRREQRADPGLAGIPIVVLSGMEMDGVQDMAAAASFHKPVSFPDVVDVVRRLCDIAH